MSASAALVEVFASLQGEGLYCGEPQIFVRLGGCPLRCLYCDTPQGLTAPTQWVAHLTTPRSGSNPVDRAALLALVAEFDRELGAPRTLSITGGEPLAQASFLRELLPHWHGQRRIHLETAGVHAPALANLAPWIDHVSMDWKLRSTMERGAFDAAHVAFLEVIAEHQLEACLKFVITPAVTGAEFTTALDLALERLPNLPIFLQPATPDRAVPQAPTAALLDELMRLALQRRARVRVLPQVHKLLGIR